jgi:hypothetical protein
MKKTFSTISMTQGKVLVPSAQSTPNFLVTRKNPFAIYFIVKIVPSQKIIIKGYLGQRG